MFTMKKTEQYPLIPDALISPFASSTSSARELGPRECAGVDADFFRLRPRRPASAASFSSRFLRASVMSSPVSAAAHHIELCLLHDYSGDLGLAVS